MARKRIGLGAFLSVLVVGVLLGQSATSSASIISGYNLGFVWNRGLDWDAGGPIGSTSGNPDDDQLGNPVWRSEYVSGDGIGGADPWYAKAGPLMVWNQVLPAYPGWHAPVPSNWKTGAAVAVFTGPSSNKPSSGNHVAYDAGYWADIPLLRWTNPTGADIIVNVLGDLYLRWGVAGSQYKVDVVIAHRAAGGTVTPLYSRGKGLSGPTDREATLPIQLLNVAVAPGEDIIITHRLRGYGPGQWAEMVNDDLSIIYVVPEPGVMILLGLGGAAILRRRRRA